MQHILLSNQTSDGDISQKVLDSRDLFLNWHEFYAFKNILIAIHKMILYLHVLLSDYSCQLPQLNSNL